MYCDGSTRRTRVTTVEATAAKVRRVCSMLDLPCEFSQGRAYLFGFSGAQWTTMIMVARGMVNRGG